MIYKPENDNGDFNYEIVDKNKAVNFISGCGHGEFEITKNQLNLLKENKVLVLYDGEYSTHITIKGDED